MSFVERVNQGESLVNWLNEPPAVCWSVIMGYLSPGPKGVYCTRPKASKMGPPSCVVKGLGCDTLYMFIAAHCPSWDMITVLLMHVPYHVTAMVPINLI